MPAVGSSIFKSVFAALFLYLCDYDFDIFASAGGPSPSVWQCVEQQTGLSRLSDSDPATLIQFSGVIQQ